MHLAGGVAVQHALLPWCREKDEGNLGTQGLDPFSQQRNSKLLAYGPRLTPLRCTLGESRTWRVDTETNRIVKSLGTSAYRTKLKLWWGDPVQPRHEIRGHRVFKRTNSGLTVLRPMAALQVTRWGPLSKLLNLWASASPSVKQG